MNHFERHFPEAVRQGREDARAEAKRGDTLTISCPERIEGFLTFRRIMKDDYGVTALPWGLRDQVHEISARAYGHDQEAKKILEEIHGHGFLERVIRDAQRIWEETDRDIAMAEYQENERERLQPQDSVVDATGWTNCPRCGRRFKAHTRQRPRGPVVECPNSECAQAIRLHERSTPA